MRKLDPGLPPSRRAKAARPGGWSSITPTMRTGNFRSAIRCTRSGRTTSILMLGRDLRPIAEMQQQLVKAQLALERDYEAQREIRHALPGLHGDDARRAGACVDGDRADHRPERRGGSRCWARRAHDLTGRGLRAGIRRPPARRIHREPCAAWPADRTATRSDRDQARRSQARRR